MMRWFGPGGLIDTGIKVVLSSIFGAYANRRELQASLALPVDSFTDYAEGKDESGSITSPISATDGMLRTHLLAQHSLDIAASDGTIQLPRGQVLLMGGDQVYPFPSRGHYEERLQRVYQGALPCHSIATPELFALPGNHDWYDGLTSFLRTFCQGGWIEGWRTKQSRSYFALRLPQGWWFGESISSSTPSLTSRNSITSDRSQMNMFEPMIASSRSLPNRAGWKPRRASHNETLRISCAMSSSRALLVWP